jgi:hypothetical protein
LIFSPVTVIGAISTAVDSSAAHAQLPRPIADPTANAIVFFLKFTPRSPATDIFRFFELAEGCLAPAERSLIQKKN